MSVEELEKAIAKLPSDELARLRAWFDEFAANEWDKQIERDIKAGKFDKLAEEALADHKAGLSRKL
jgi:hypothetical protein